MWPCLCTQLSCHLTRLPSSGGLICNTTTRLLVPRDCPEDITKYVVRCIPPARAEKLASPARGSKVAAGAGTPGSESKLGPPSSQWPPQQLQQSPQRGKLSRVSADDPEGELQQEEAIPHSQTARRAAKGRANTSWVSSAARPTFACARLMRSNTDGSVRRGGLGEEREVKRRGKRRPTELQLGLSLGLAPGAASRTRTSRPTENWAPGSRCNLEATPAGYC